MTQSDVLQQPQAVLEGIGTTPAADAHTTHDERKEKKRKEKMVLFSNHYRRASKAAARISHDASRSRCLHRRVS